MMSVVAKIDQQNNFFTNMQLSTKFTLLASNYLLFEHPLLSLLRTPSYSIERLLYVISTYQRRLFKYKSGMCAAWVLFHDHRNKLFGVRFIFQPQRTTKIDQAGRATPKQ